MRMNTGEEEDPAAKPPFHLTAGRVRCANNRGLETEDRSQETGKTWPRVPFTQGVGAAQSSFVLLMYRINFIEGVRY